MTDDVDELIPVGERRIVTSTRALGPVKATTTVCSSSSVRSACQPSSVVTSTTSSTPSRRCTVTVPPAVRMVLWSTPAPDEDDVLDEVDEDDVDDE